MTVRVGSPAPTLALDAYLPGEAGPRRIDPAALRGSWVVLVFYPRDFTFVCPTELQAFAALEAEFDAAGAVILAASTDSYYVHKAWFEGDPRLQGATYPVLADTAHELSAAYGVLTDDGAALRGTFVIDPDGILRHASVNDLDVGRDPAETLRIVQAFQTRELCPACWKPGDATLTVAPAAAATGGAGLPNNIVTIEDEELARVA